MAQIIIQRTAKRRDHWAVTVERNGEQIVCIESNCLSGRVISPEDEETIRTAARHLLAFIGDGLIPEHTK